MIGKLLGFKEVLKHNLGYCKLFDTKLNGNPCSKITLKVGSPSVYSALLEHKHPNLFSILKISNHSIYMQKLQPLAPFVDNSKMEYNRYLISTLLATLKYIHATLKKEHNTVDIESIFIEDSGKVILGNFSKFSEYKDGIVDFNMLEQLSKNLTNKSLKDLDTESPTIFEMIFDSDFRDISSNPILLPEKLSAIINQKTNIPEITCSYLFDIFIEDLNKSIPKENKDLLLDFLFRLNREMFIKNVQSFFKILDTNVRLCILKRFNDFDIMLNDVTDDLALGLRVKEKTLKKTTIDFIFENISKFDDPSFDFIIEKMQYCTDSESISVICAHFMNIKRNNMKSIYKVLECFILLDKNNLPVYQCIEKYHTCFDQAKLAKHILPVLCARLIDKSNQDYCFRLLEKIINYLKITKEESGTKDWSLKNLKSLKNIFSKKSETENNEIYLMKQNQPDFDEWE